MREKKNMVHKKLLAAVLASCLFAASTFAAQLQDVSVVNVDSDTVEVRFMLDEAAPQPLSFTIDSPARISLDLPDTTMGDVDRRRKVDVGVLNSIMSAEANGRTRVVLGLDSMVPYNTRTEGNTVVVTLGDDSNYSQAFTSQAIATPPAATPVETAALSATPSATRNYVSSSAIKDVDFRRGIDGAGRLIVKLSDPSTQVDVAERGGKIVATFKDADVPAGLQRRMDVLDFGTPVSTIDTLSANGDTRMLITANGDYEQLVYQSEDTFTVEIRERVKVPTELLPLEQRTYTGTPINLNFQSIDVRAVLQLLASNGDFNIVVSDSVSGTVTLRLQNVPWDQALDIVLQTKGLDKRTKDNVVLVAPAAELAAQEQQQLQAVNDLQQLEPIRSDIIQINYAKASEIRDLLAQTTAGISTEAADGGDQSFLSSRGGATVDERTNSLLIYDTAAKLVQIRKLIEVLDVPIAQVLIESRVVVANTDFSRELGVRSGFSTVSDNSSDGLVSVSGTAVGANNTAVNFEQGNSPLFADQLERLNVNLPVASPAGSIGVAILNGSYLVDLELSALQAEGRGEIISSPRVTATNQQEASILQGVQIPFQESSGGAAGATTTSFKDAVLSMKVTPLITPDEYIIMDLDIAQDSVGELITGSTGTIPTIDTRQLTTQVRIKNGETAVLGGIYETEQRNGVTKVPVLGDIPVVGTLFRSKTRTDDKSEMLIFITPKILNDDNVAQ